MTDQTPCPRHPNRPPEPGHLLCHACITWMDRDLAYLAGHWHHLAALHTSTSANSGTRTVHPSPPCPVRVDVLDLADDIQAVVSAWMRLVIEERDLNPQDSPQNTPQAAVWLRRHVDWLSGTPYGDDAADELSDARRRLASIIGDTNRGQRVECACGNTLRLELADLEATIRCRRCGYSTTAGMLLRMVVTGEIVDRDPVDADTITHVTGIPRSTLDRWARAGRIRRDHGRYWYSEVVAEAATRRMA